MSCLPHSHKNPYRVRTLQNWEQNRRQLTGPAAALLKLVATAHEVALHALANTRRAA